MNQGHSRTILRVIFALLLIALAALLTWAMWPGEDSADTGDRALRQAQKRRGEVVELETAVPSDSQTDEVGKATGAEQDADQATKAKSDGGPIIALLRVRFSDEIEKALEGFDRRRVLESLDQTIQCRRAQVPNTSYEDAWKSGYPEHPLPRHANQPIRWKLDALPHGQQLEWQYDNSWLDPEIRLDLPAPKILSPNLYDFGEIILSMGHSKPSKQTLLVKGSIKLKSGIPFSNVQLYDLRLEYVGNPVEDENTSAALPKDSAYADMVFDAQGRFIAFVSLDVGELPWQSTWPRLRAQLRNLSARGTWGREDLAYFHVPLQSALTPLSCDVGELAFPGALLEYTFPSDLPPPFTIRGERRDDSGPFQLSSQFEFDTSGFGAGLEFYTSRQYSLGDVATFHIYPGIYSMFASAMSMPTKVDLGESSFDLSLQEGQKFTHRFKFAKQEVSAIRVFAEGKELQEAVVTVKSYSESDFPYPITEHAQRFIAMDIKTYDKRFDSSPLPYHYEWWGEEGSDELIHFGYAYNNQYEPHFFQLKRGQREIQVHLTNKWREGIDKRLQVTLRAPQGVGGGDWDRYASFKLYSKNEEREVSNGDLFTFDGRASVSRPISLSEGPHELWVEYDGPICWGYPVGPISEVQTLSISGEAGQAAEFQLPRPPFFPHVVRKGPFRATCGDNEVSISGYAIGRFGRAIDLGHEVSGWPESILDGRNPISIQCKSNSREDDEFATEGPSPEFSVELPVRVRVTIDFPAAQEGWFFSLRLHNQKESTSTSFYGRLKPREVYSLWAPPDTATLTFHVENHLCYEKEIEIGDAIHSLTIPTCDPSMHLMKFVKGDDWKRLQDRDVTELENYLRLQLWSGELLLWDETTRGTCTSALREGLYRVALTYRDEALWSREFEVGLGLGNSISYPLVELPKTFTLVLNYPKDAAPPIEYARLNRCYADLKRSLQTGMQDVLTYGTTLGFETEGLIEGSELLLFGGVNDQNGSFFYLLPQKVRVRNAASQRIEVQWTKGVRFQWPGPDLKLRRYLVMEVHGQSVVLSQRSGELWSPVDLPQGRVLLSILDTQAKTLWSREFDVKPDDDGQWQLPDDAIADLLAKGLMEKR